MMRHMILRSARLSQQSPLWTSQLAVKHLTWNLNDVTGVTDYLGGRHVHTNVNQQESKRTGLGSWMLKELMFMPNAVSMARLMSGPCIAALIINDAWSVATISLLFSGASDWLDGYLAKHMHHQSVLGSFLDPLADKVLIASTAGALLYQGSLPYWVVIPVLARDVCLILGTYLHFIKAGITHPLHHLMKLKGRGYNIRPLPVSKINTIVQLSLVASCMGHGWIDWPTADHIDLLSKLTVGTTLASWGTYSWYYLNDKGVIQ